MATVTVSRTADRLIAVKQVRPGRAGDIAREAGTLKRLDHPGVVRFVNVVETRDGGRALHTEFVSSDTWATRPLIDPAERAEGMAALAGVVADLHDLGIAHCRINPSHVLFGADDRPVLCGLRLAAEATPENRREDLVALAELCCDPALERKPLTGKLSALADAARAGQLSTRELARRLDLLVGKRSTAAEPARAARNGDGRHQRERSRRSLMLVAALLSAAAVVLAAGTWSRRGQTASTPATITAATGAPAAAIGAPTAATGSPAGPVPAAPTDRPDAAVDPSPADPSPASDGTASVFNPGASGSPVSTIPIAADRDPVEGHATNQSGTVVEHEGSLYGIGAPGDFVRTGDWDCDGQPTPSIVRPSTGHIVLFDVWPGPGQSISMPVRWEVDAPTGAEAVAHGSCDLLRVYTSGGSTLFDPMEGR